MAGIPHHSIDSHKKVTAICTILLKTAGMLKETLWKLNSKDHSHWVMMKRSDSRKDGLRVWIAATQSNDGLLYRLLTVCKGTKILLEGVSVIMFNHALNFGKGDKLPLTDTVCKSCSLHVEIRTQNESSYWCLIQSRLKLSYYFCLVTRYLVKSVMIKCSRTGASWTVLNPVPSNSKESLTETCLIQTLHRRPH